jgi:dihydrofolate reductase
MRRVVLFIATSLDGYIARKDGSIDWLFDDADYGYAAFYASIDTVLVGRRTYEQALGFGVGDPFEGKRTIVFTRTRSGRHDRAEFTAEDPAALVARLRDEPGADIWLVGGAELVAAFVRERLIDEFVISIHPLLMGAGIPLFAPGAPETPLRSARAETFASGLVQLTYETVRRP